MNIKNKLTGSKLYFYPAFNKMISKISSNILIFWKIENKAK